MCLPVKPYKVEREWKHKGLSCAVVQAREASNRCGYVRVPPGHPAFKKDYSDVIEVSVHGGLTFAALEPCTEHADGQGWWLGFDCAHYQDAMYDPNANLEDLTPATREIMKIHKDIHGKYPNTSDGHFWTEGEVIAECEQLADQLAEMK